MQLRIKKGFAGIAKPCIGKVMPGGRETTRTSKQITVKEVKGIVSTKNTPVYNR